MGRCIGIAQYLKMLKSDLLRRLAPNTVNIRCQMGPSIRQLPFVWIQLREAFVFVLVLVLKSLTVRPTIRHVHVPHVRTAIL